MSGNSAGAEIKDGEYSIPSDVGLLPGRHRVEIRATRGTGMMVHPGMGAPQDAQVERMESYIPSQYNSQTILTVEVEPSDNPDSNFDLSIND
ncbi:hypothetical protein [Symmachiella dynata]|uniref:hypothetical protein n=1 Tax=Symmachiella dynata TaxID=2527995 RepID=UPI0030EF6F72